MVKAIQIQLQNQQNMIHDLSKVVMASNLPNRFLTPASARSNRFDLFQRKDTSQLSSTPVAQSASYSMALPSVSLPQAPLTAPLLPPQPAVIPPVPTAPMANPSATWGAGTVPPPMEAPTIEDLQRRSANSAAAEPEPER